MGTYALGADAALSAQFRAVPGGPGVDPASATLTITRDDVVVVGPVLWPDDPAMQRVAPGSFLYHWSIPSNAELGDYLATWVGSVGGIDQTGTEVLTVVTAGLVATGGGPRTCWATAADVFGLTGVGVSDQTVLQANAAVEVVAGRTYSLGSNRTGRTDTEWMRRAVSYQAAWLLEQPDAFQRMDLLNLSAGGRGATLTPTGVVLAPMARWALRRVSWLRSRSVRIRTEFVDGGQALAPSATAEVNDELETWEPIAGGWG